MIELELYETREGRVPFSEFLDSLKNYQDRARIQTRLDRVENGNFGDHSSVGDGVNELRFFFGPGYRVYYALKHNEWIVLLCAGDKKTQKKDIYLAKKYWQDYKIRRLLK